MSLMTKLFPKEEKKEQKKQERSWKFPEFPKLTDNAIEYDSSDGIKVKIEKNIYTTEEPTLTETEKSIYTTIKTALYEVINIEENTDQEVYLKKILLIIITELDLSIGEKSFEKIFYILKKEIIGLGKIEPLLKDPLIASIIWKNNGGTVEVKHRIYELLKTNIMLNEEETKESMTKILIQCKQEIPEEEQKILCEDQKRRYILNWKKEKSTFLYEKKLPKIYSPLELVLARRISPEILAYLWIAMEKKERIIVNKDILFTLSFFLPAHAKVYANREEFFPNRYTETQLNKNQEEAFAFIEDYTEQTTYSGALIATTKTTLREENYILCEGEQQIESIKEKGKELFIYKEKKFLYSLAESKLIQEHALAKEHLLRTKLLSVLIKNKVKEEDFKKIISLYTENAQVVLKKAGIS